MRFQPISGRQWEFAEQAATYIPNGTVNVMHILESGLFHPFFRFINGVVASARSRHTLDEVQQRRPSGGDSIVIQVLSLYDQTAAWQQQLETMLQQFN